MNFGVNLPGPFRVGFGRKGRVTLGASMGPFSVSTSAASRRSASPHAVVLRGTTLAIQVDQALAEGWRITGRDDRTVLLARDGDMLRLHAVSPLVVEATPVDSRAKVIGTLIGVLLPITLCFVACSAMTGR
jgi:hypothetical protein